MDLARDLLGAVQALCLGAVTLEAVLMISRLVSRAVSSAGR